MFSRKEQVIFLLDVGKNKAKHYVVMQTFSRNIVLPLLGYLIFYTLDQTFWPANHMTISLTQLNNCKSQMISSSPAQTFQSAWAAFLYQSTGSCPSQLELCVSAHPPENCPAAVGSRQRKNRENKLMKNIVLYKLHKSHYRYYQNNTVYMIFLFSCIK